MIGLLKAVLVASAKSVCNLFHSIVLFFYSVPPTFVKTPTNIEVSVTDRQVLFRCLATGYPKPSITWRKDGKPLESDIRHVMTENGALNIIDPKFSDEGSYECVAQNSAGVIVSKAALNYFGVEGNEQLTKRTTATDLIRN